MMCLTKREKGWLDQLLSRADFLEKRIKKDNRFGPSWDEKELHAIEWAIECITFRYGDKPCSNCGRIKGEEHEEGCPHEEQWELENKLERCGFCGSFFRGEHLLDLDECKQLTDEEYKEAPLGYCPNALGEAEQQTPDQYNSDDYPR